MRSYSFRAALVGLLLTSGVFADPLEKDPDIKKDYDRLQGMWKLVAFEGGGVDQTKRNFPNGLTFEFPGNKFLWKSGKETRDETFTIDPTKTPRQIDFSDNDPTYLCLGIYQLDKDSLLIGWGDEKERPTDFVTKDVPVACLYRLTRVKAK